MVRNNNLYRAICLSAALHAALIGAASYAARLKPTPPLDGGGKGDSFEVSIISEVLSENTAIGAKFAPRRNTVRTNVSQRLTTQMLAPSKATQPNDGSTASSGRSAGSGGGWGGGQGENVGPGHGKGDPLLSRIWSKINRSKYYPLHAKRNAWEGNPRVTFKIGKEGQIEYVRLAKTCGITLLDDAAIETIRRATPLPHYPKAITLTIRYSLRE